MQNNINILFEKLNAHIAESLRVTDLEKFQGKSEEDFEILKGNVIVTFIK